MENKGSLTSLRFFAAYMVVASHYFVLPAPLDFMNDIFLKGYLGFEFFFILSGFVLGLRYTKEITEGQFASGQFFYNRMVRIAPAYYFSLFLALPLLYRALQKPGFLESWFNRGLLVAANLGFFQAFVPATSLYEDWNLPSWSLSVEFVYYALFPFLAPMMIKTTKENFWLGTLFFLTIILFIINNLLPAYISLFGYESRISWINCPLLRLPQFLIGILLAKKYLSPQTSKKFAEAGFYLVMAGTLFIFIYPMPYNQIGMGSPISILIFSVLIFFCTQRDQGKGVLNNKLLILLGEASYSLYIFQAPLKTLFQQVYSKVLHLGDSQGLLYCSYLSFTLIVSSCLLYKFMEVPVNRFLRQRMEKVVRST